MSIFSRAALGLRLFHSATAGELTKKPIRITQGGTAEKPAVFDGKGMVIDLGIDVTDHAWQKDDDNWTSTTAIAGPKRTTVGGASQVECSLVRARRTSTVFVV